MNEEVHVAAAPVAPKQAAAPVWHPPRMRRPTMILVVLLALAAILAVLAAWHLWPFGGAEITENAYVRGRTTVVAPQVSGYVTQVAVKDYEFVKAGQVLARIDDRVSTSGSLSCAIRSRHVPILSGSRSGVRRMVTRRSSSATRQKRNIGPPSSKFQPSSLPSRGRRMA